MSRASLVALVALVVGGLAHAAGCGASEPPAVAPATSAAATASPEPSPASSAAPSIAPTTEPATALTTTPTTAPTSAPTSAPSAVPAAAESYVTRHCTCGGVEPKRQCLYRSKGDSLDKLRAADQNGGPCSPNAGCRMPVRYTYCD